MKFGKKGVSAVVAVVLLILLVVSLAAIIFAWARGVVTDKTEDRQLSVDELCDSMDFDVGVFGGSGNARNLEIVNRGNADVGAFEFKVFYSAGDSYTFVSDFGIDAGDSIVENGVNFGTDIGNSAVVDGVEVYPVLKVTDKQNVTCRDDPYYLRV